MTDVGVELPPIPTPAEVRAAGLRIAIGLPMERTISDLSVLHLWPIAQRGWPLISPRLYGRTDVNRCGFAQELLDSDYTHILMLDLDQLHPADTVERLARWVMDDPNKLVIASLSFRRGEPFDPLAFTFGSDGRLHAPIEWPHGIVEAAAVGHGSILIHRSVFERTPWPWWAYAYDERDGERHVPTEDMWFCEQLREAAIRIWVDTTTTAPHLIQSTVTEESWRRYLEQHPVTILSRDDAPVPVGASANGRE